MVCFKQNCGVSKKLNRLFLGYNARILFVMIVWLCMCMRMLLSVILFIEKEIKCYLVPSPNSYSSNGVIRAVIKISPLKKDSN